MGAIESLITDETNVFGVRFSVFGFRFSPFRFPGLGPTQGAWPVRVSCVETCTQFAFHRSCTPRHARVRAHGNVFESAVNMRNRATFKARTSCPGLRTLRCTPDML